VTEFVAPALNFSWLEDGLVAGCRGPRTDQDLASLLTLRVRRLVRLAPEDETGLRRSQVARSEIQDCYEPVPDWTAPSQDQIDRVIAFIRTAVEHGEPVAVSCGAGCGRTGTVLACYLVAKGLSPNAAIDKLVIERPCSDEILRVPGQKEAVFHYHRRMKETG
jgi:atypical dual specificity phosphatase